MKEKRYYTSETLKVNSTAIIDEDEFHHLANVMRERVGNSVCLFNGDGNFYFGTIKNISKKNAEIYVDHMQKSTSEPKVNLSIFQALAKGDKLSLITQKITELGASNLCLFDSKFCDVKANTTKHERLESISISAAKQCGRASLVKVNGIYSIKEVVGMINSYDKFYVAYENKTGKTLADSILENQNIKNIAVMIGAEGGFSEDEIDLLENSGAEIVSLGSRILRTETAAIACTSLIMQILDKN